MADVVKLVFSSAYNGAGVRQFVAGIGDATRSALRTTGAARSLASAMSSVGGAAGGAVGDVARFVSSFSQLGAVGAIITGVQMLFEKLAQTAIEAEEAHLRKMMDVYERCGEKLNELNEMRMDGVKKALDEATVKAKEAADAFEALASAYMKVEKANAATAQSGSAAALSDMELEKAKAMAAAGSDSERAVVGAGWDVDIASAKLRNTESAQAVAVAAARDEATIKAQQAKAALDAENMAAQAEAQANAIHNEDVHVGNTTNIKKSKAALEKADKALTDAINERIRKQAEAEAAAERVKQAENTRTAAINEATRGLIEAEETERRLVDAQKKAAEAELKRVKEAERAAEAQRRKAEADRRAAEQAEKAGALTSFRDSAKSQFERAFDLWRDPEAAKAAQDEEKRREDDMKRFRKDVGRYGGKWRIDEYAELMRQGDEEGMQSKLAEWRKSSKFTPQVEQMVKAAAAEQNENAAERALQNIEKNTADLASKIDQLLQVK